MKHIEDDHQRALFKWADHRRLSELHFPVPAGSKVGDYLYAVPNGGKRNGLEAARLKGLGVRAGIPDVFLSMPVDKWAGLYIEMKRPIVKGKAKPKLSPQQKDKLERFSKAGYCCRVAYHWAEARDFILAYLFSRTEIALAHGAGGTDVDTL